MHAVVVNTRGRKTNRQHCPQQQLPHTCHHLHMGEDGGGTGSDGGAHYHYEYLYGVVDAESSREVVVVS